MKQYLTMLMLLSLFSACSEQKEISEVDRSQLIEKLASEPAVLRVKNAMEHENKLMAEGKIDFTHFNHDLVNRESKNCKTMDESIALYKEAGMENPEDYLLAIKELNESLRDLKIQVPEMAQLSPKEFSQLIRPNEKSHQQAITFLMRKNKISEKAIQQKIKPLQ